MKVLLINSNQFKQPWPVMPFGLSWLAEYISQKGYKVEFLDLCFSKNTQEDIRQKIKEFKPDIVGVSIRNIDNCSAYNTMFLLDDVKKNVIDFCKKYFNGTIIIGGPSVGISAVEMLDYFDLEFAIRGDGEEAMCEFLRRIKNNLILQDLQGLVWRKKGKIIVNNEPLRVQNLNTLPLVTPDKYLDVEKYKKYGSPIQIQTKRGCALNCSYCVYNSIEGRKWRLRDPKRVVDDIEKMYRRTKIDIVEFTDSCFNLPLEHCKNVLKEIVNRNLKLNYRTMGLNPAAVDEELMELLTKAGFSDVDIGIESGCDVNLKSLGKNFRVVDILKTGELFKKYKIPVTWYLMFGALTETEDTISETFQIVDKIAKKYDLINIGIGVRIYNNSPLAILYKQNNHDDNGNNYNNNFLLPTPLIPKEISLERMKVIIKSVSLTKDNYFMYDEDEKTPLIIMFFLNLLSKIPSKNKPVWHYWIILRKIQKKMGILKYKRKSYLKKVNF